MFRVECDFDNTSLALAHFAEYDITAHTMTVNKSRCILNFIYADVLLKMPDLEEEMEQLRLMMALEGATILPVMTREEILQNLRQ